MGDSVSHSSHYTRIFSVLLWGCNWILFMHEWFSPIHLIGREDLFTSKKIRILLLFIFNRRFTGSTKFFTSIRLGGPPYGAVIKTIHITFPGSLFVCLKLGLVQFFPFKSTELLYYLVCTRFWCPCCQLSSILGQSKVSSFWCNW